MLEIQLQSFVFSSRLLFKSGNWLGIVNIFDIHLVFQILRERNRAKLNTLTQFKRSSRKNVESCAGVAIGEAPQLVLLWREMLSSRSNSRKNQGDRGKVAPRDTDR